MWCFGADLTGARLAVADLQFASMKGERITIRVKGDDRCRFRPLGLFNAQVDLIITELLYLMDVQLLPINSSLHVPLKSINVIEMRYSALMAKESIKSADFRNRLPVGCTGAWLCGLIGSAYGFWIQNRNTPALESSFVYAGSGISRNRGLRAAVGCELPAEHQRRGSISSKNRKIEARRQ